MNRPKSDSSRNRHETRRVKVYRVQEREQQGGDEKEGGGKGRSQVERNGKWTVTSGLVWVYGLAPRARSWYVPRVYSLLLFPCPFLLAAETLSPAAIAHGTGVRSHYAWCTATSRPSSDIVICKLHLALGGIHNRTVGQSPHARNFIARTVGRRITILAGNCVHIICMYLHAHAVKYRSTVLRLFAVSCFLMIEFIIVFSAPGFSYKMGNEVPSQAFTRGENIFYRLPSDPLWLWPACLAIKPVNRGCIKVYIIWTAFI